MPNTLAARSNNVLMLFLVGATPWAPRKSPRRLVVAPALKLWQTFAIGDFQPKPLAHERSKPHWCLSGARFRGVEGPKDEGGKKTRNLNA